MRNPNILISNLKFQISNLKFQISKLTFSICGINRPDSLAGPTPWRRAALACVIFSAGGLLFGCKSAPEPVVTPTVTVQVGAAEKQAIERKVNADAILYPLEQAAIVPKISSPVKKIYVDRGAHVKAGQLLAELENADLAGSVTDSNGSVAQAELTYQSELDKEARDTKLAKEVLDSAQRVYDSRVMMLKEGAVSEKDVDDALVSLTTAQNAYDLQVKQLNLKTAEAALSSAKGRSSAAEAQLNYSKIISPIDGVITDRPVYPGETPAAGAPLITVMNLSQIVARAHISPEEAASLKVGDAATISAPGITPSIKGRVSMVSAALDPGSTTVEVWVSAANPQDKLKPGASVHVAMVAETVPKAIVAPAASLLTTTDGVTSVIVLDTDNVPHKKKVETGIRDGDDVQITKGLNGGERVVTMGAFQLANEDDDVLPKTKIQVQSPTVPEDDEDEDN
jgi:HlyD family secretion protein